MTKEKYRSFEQARKFARSQKFQNREEWKNFVKSGKLPDDIPRGPAGVYKNKGWKGWGDFLGTGFVSFQNRKYRSFKEARKFVHTLNLKSSKEWIRFTRSGKLPDDIPSAPNNTYKNKGWKGMGDWLGTGTIASYNIQYRPFKEARKFVHKQNLKSNREWIKFTKSGKLPDDIPKNPQNSYKNKGWVNWGDWLGTGQKFSKINKKIRTYEKARKFVHKQNLKSNREWIKFTKSGKLPDDIPTNPRYEYKNKGWKSMGDWLGTGTIATFNMQYRSYEQARKFVHKLGIKNQGEWREYSKSGKLPDDIPGSPQEVYKNKGWKDWGDFLGTGFIAMKLREYRSFEKARKFVHSLNLKSQRAWFIFTKSKKFPHDIPVNPSHIYKNKGWKNMGDWLGTGNISHKEKSESYLPPQEAKPIIQKLAKEYGLKNRKDWSDFAKTHKKLLQKLRLPADPVAIYSLKRAKKRSKK